jgi:hypothetical protein
MGQDLRAYFFTNMYLTGIHAGIQAQHCTTRMFVKYTNALMGDVDGREKMQDCENMLFDWARNHETTIILNGGYASNLGRIAGFLNNDENDYPWEFFCESEEALNGCVTSVGIILPSTVYDSNRKISKWLDERYNGSGYPNKLSDFQLQLAMEVSQCRLMG